MRIFGTRGRLFRKYVVVLLVLVGGVLMRERVDHLVTIWQKRGYELALGVGIAQGYATIGAIGFEGRWDYGAIGTVTNLAARLCGEAKGGQILVHQRVATSMAPLPAP